MWKYDFYWLIYHQEKHVLNKLITEKNPQDCIERLWLKSDPKVRYAGPMKICSICKVVNEKSTVSCQLKKNNSVKYHPDYQTCMTFYEFYISEFY